MKHSPSFMIYYILILYLEQQIAKWLPRPQPARDKEKIEIINPRKAGPRGKMGTRAKAFPFHHLRWAPRSLPGLRLCSALTPSLSRLQFALGSFILKQVEEAGKMVLYSFPTFSFYLVKLIVLHNFLYAGDVLEVGGFDTCWNSYAGVRLREYLNGINGKYVQSVWILMYLCLYCFALFGNISEALIK